MTTKYVFDLNDDDVFWCTADVGWVTGHSYLVYGPLSNGATCVMYEGAPDWPEKDRFWDICERYGVTILYTAPTAIRAFMKWGDRWPKHDLARPDSWPVGEPINPKHGWYQEHMAAVAVRSSTWWQTETGAIVICPLPGITETKPGARRRHSRLRGGAARRERQGHSRRGRARWRSLPWPSMLRTIWATTSDTCRRTHQGFGRPDLYFGDGAARRRRLLWILGELMMF
jgi:acetyl-CoA synthetase